MTTHSHSPESAIRIRPRLVIEPGLASANYWRDLWRYRELMYFLAWRDIVVRYKQTAIGVLWALIRPALTMTVFVLFRRLMGNPVSSVPDPILVLAAVLPWQFFSSALQDASGSMLGNSNLIAKIYFPRLIVPVASVITAFADFLLTLFLLAALMAWYRFAPGWTIVALPVFALLAAALAFGAGLFFAALNVKYRDFRYVVPFVVQIGLFVSPIAFATSAVPEWWRTLYFLNPLVGIIDGFRWSVLGPATPIVPAAMVTSGIGTVVSLVVGVWYFRRMERSFADVI
jgi:lipopolysaccharide transport system permease protein